MGKKRKKRRKQKRSKPSKSVKLTHARVQKAIPRSYGIISDIARRCRVSRQALYDFLDKKENDDLNKLIQKEEEAVLDLAENKLVTSLNKREAWAIKLLLTTKGRKRGYSQKVDVESFDITGFMEDLQSNLPDSLPFLRRVVKGEDIRLIKSEYELYRYSKGKSAGNN